MPRAAPAAPIGCIGVECRPKCAYSPTMNEISPPPRRRAKPQPDLAPAGTPPHVAVAPGLLDREHVVTREDDDTDADYDARCRLLAAALRVARQG